MFHPAHRKYLEVDDQWVDLTNVDRERFVDFDKATPVELLLKPGETLYIPRKWPHFALGLDATVSLTLNFLPRCHRQAVMLLLIRYMTRRGACEDILGRQLRASDNLMKFCCHGGRIDLSAVDKILGADQVAALRKACQDDESSIGDGIADS